MPLNTICWGTSVGKSLHPHVLLSFPRYYLLAFDLIPEDLFFAFVAEITTTALLSDLKFPKGWQNLLSVLPLSTALSSIVIYHISPSFPNPICVQTQL